ncbi:MAG: T9SS type A sorting domain-containing protein [Candidatus Eisenbacteria bacterium]|nr:T9SS type A sorting domain-containing protein [Candidatus Eisenbacteria bacterium]
MRSTLLVAALCCLAGALPAGAVTEGADALTLRTVPSPGAIRLTVRDDGPVPFAAETVRWIALPPDAAEPRLLPSAGKENPPVRAFAGPVMKLRGVSVLPIRFAPAADKASAGAELRRAFDLEIRYETAPGKGGAGAAAAMSRGFYDPFLDLFPEDQRSALAGAGEEGGMLIVTHPSLEAAAEPLAEWKRSLGYDVTLVTTNETGTRNDEIRSYIKGLYDGSGTPPQYVLLLGDVEQVAGFDYHQSVTDLPYSLMDDDDFLPDLEVGRLSAQNADDLETIVAKILRYEGDPYIADTTWYGRALLVAGDYSSNTPVPVSRWCRDQLYDAGFTAVDTVFYPPHWGTGAPFIRSSVNKGVSLVSYRGWAYGWRGWEPPHFTVDEIPSLSNGWMLPAVFSFVCENGNFTNTECFGEAWIRAGTASSPKGGIAFIGNSEHWSHTRHNDAAAIGAFRAIRERGERRLGAILNSAKAEIWRSFPDQIPYDPYTDESVEFYYYIYGLLGDPSLEIRTAVPRTIHAAWPDTIPPGTGRIEVAVFEADGATFVEGARVGLSRGGVTLGRAWTDEYGRATVLANVSAGAEPVRLTVTGPGIFPVLDSAAVDAGRPELSLAEVWFTDDGSYGSDGDGDGLPEPGEILALRIRLAGDGAQSLSGVTASLGADGAGATVVTGVSTFPDILAGGSAWSDSTWTVLLGAGLEEGFRARLRVDAIVDGDTTTHGFDLVVRAPDPVYVSHSLEGDGVLDPGEFAGIDVVWRNDGANAPATHGVLRAVTPGLAFAIDSTADYAAVDSGGTSPAGTFGIQATDTAAVGRAAVFTLLLTADDGRTTRTDFSVVIGAVDHRAPLGPDRYGYWAYDNSDTDYPDAAPLFEWVEISPTYGGSGISLGLGDGDGAVRALPFPFVYYGVSYDSILISDNGWAAFDLANRFDFYNWSLPNSYGNAAMIAPFWDNLNPEKEENDVPVGDGIYAFYDDGEHRYVIEWSRLGNLRSQHDNHEDWDDLQTFEMIFYDPAYRDTPTGDGVIRFQYKRIVNNDDERMYATVGIENMAEDDGLEYSYSDLYPAAAAPLSAGLAVEFTTRSPRYDPFTLAAFTAKACEEGVRLDWIPGDDRPLAGYRIYRVGAGGDRLLLPGGALGPEARSHVDRDVDPAAEAAYEIGSIDPTGAEKLLGPCVYEGRGARAIRFALGHAGPNPARGGVLLSYALPERGDARLRIYSVTGRMIRTLVRETVDPGVRTVEWDGRDDRGRSVPSGVYFARLQAGAGERRIKLTLLR